MSTSKKRRVACLSYFVLVPHWRMDCFPCENLCWILLILWQFQVVFFWPLYLFDCRMHSAWLACWLVALGTIERRTAFKTCDRQCWMCDIAFVQKAFCTVVNRQKTFYLLVPLVYFVENLACDTLSRLHHWYLQGCVTEEAGAGGPGCCKISNCIELNSQTATWQRGHALLVFMSHSHSDWVPWRLLQAQVANDQKKKKAPETSNVAGA